MTKAWRRLAGAVLVLLVTTQGAALAADPLRVTRPVQATKGDLVPTRTYSSPEVKVDPRNRRRVVAGFVDMRARRCGLLRSLDGGETWKQLDSSPSLPSYPFCFHTSGGVVQTALAFGRDGTLYYGLTGWDVQDGGQGRNVSILLARSDDLGDTWQTTIVRNARGKQEADVERNIITDVVVDTKSGSRDVVYVGWRANYPLARPSRPSLPMVAVSTDGGRRFSEPRNAVGPFFEQAQVRETVLRTAPPTTAAPTTTAPAAPPTTTSPQSAPGTIPPGAPPAPPAAAPSAPRDAVANFGGGNPKLAVDGKGALYVLWPQATANIEPRPDNPLYLSRSTDQGRTFTVHQAAPPSNWYGGAVMRWSPKGGPDGSLHVVTEDKLGQTQGDRDIYYRRSTDGGRTWSEGRVIHDDDPELLIGQFIPNLSVAPNGRLDAVWWDFRNDPGTYVNDVYYAYSTDDGKTWSRNIRVTDRSINRRIGPWSNNFDMRQPPGVASTNAYALMAWDDTRNGDPVGQAQDVYASAVQFRQLAGGASNTLKYVLAGVIGLLVAGLALLALALTARRRTGGPPPAAETVPAAGREAAGVG